MLYVNRVGSDNQQYPIDDSNSCADIVDEFSDHSSVRYIKSNFVRKTSRFLNSVYDETGQI